VGAHTDIIEGVNRDTVNAATLHTSAGCDMTSVNQTQLMTGTFLEPNCDTTAGNVRAARQSLCLFAHRS
jgi:hypothetical protein